MDPAKERQGTRDGTGQSNVPLLKLDLLFTLWITSILQFIIFLFLFDHPETEGQTLAPFQVSIVQDTRNEFLRISTASSGSLYKLQCSKWATVINLLLCRQREREHHFDTWCVVENLQALPSGDTEKKKNQCSPWLRKTGQWVRVAATKPENVGLVTNWLLQAVFWLPQSTMLPKHLSHTYIYKKSNKCNTCFKMIW